MTVSLDGKQTRTHHQVWQLELQRAERELHAARLAERGAHAAARIAASGLGSKDLVSVTLARGALARLERISDDLRTAKETRDALQAKLTALEAASQLGIRERSLTIDLLAIVLLVSGMGFGLSLSWDDQPAATLLAGGLAAIGLLLGWRRLLIGSFSDSGEATLQEALTEAEARLERIRERLQVLASDIGLRVDEPLMVNEFHLLIERLLVLDRLRGDAAREQARLEVAEARYQHISRQLGQTAHNRHAETALQAGRSGSAETLGSGLVDGQQRRNKKQHDQRRHAEAECD